MKFPPSSIPATCPGCGTATPKSSPAGAAYCPRCGLRLDDFSVALNPAQLEATTALDGPLVVVAGAGSGKTRVIEYRVLNLISKGVDPERILLLTFTRKAAREMLRRASRLRQHPRRHVPLLRQRHPAFHPRDQRPYQRLQHPRRPRLRCPHRPLPATAGPVARAGFPKPETLRDLISRAANTARPLADIIQRDCPWAQRYPPLCITARPAA